MVHLRPHTSNSSVAKRDLTGPGSIGRIDRQASRFADLVTHNPPAVRDPRRIGAKRALLLLCTGSSERRDCSSEGKQ